MPPIGCDPVRQLHLMVAHEGAAPGPPCRSTGAAFDALWALRYSFLTTKPCAVAAFHDMSARPSSAARVVVFDFGFTLWDEQKSWAGWATWLGVTPLEFYSVLGALIERGEHHHRAFELFRPGFDLAQERQKRREAGQSDAFHPQELYADVVPCLHRLRSAGYRTGVAGNHFADVADTLRAMNLPLDFIGSSDQWGVEKPSPRFFARVVQTADVLPGEIAYVGDRLDNDVLPSKAAEMVSVFLARGPWGRIHSLRADASQADIRIHSLSELPERLVNFR